MKLLMSTTIAAIEYAANLVLSGFYVMFMALGLMILIAAELTNNREVKE